MKHNDIEITCEVLWVSNDARMPINGAGPVSVRNALVRQTDEHGVRKLLLMTIPKKYADKCAVRVGDIGIMRFYVTGIFLNGDFRNLAIGVSFTYTASANYKRFADASQTNT